MAFPHCFRICLVVIGWLLTVVPLEAAEPVRVRVLSYNIHIGIGMDKKLDLARTAETITRLKPDLVALQEVDRWSKRVQGIDEPAELARLTGMNYAFGKALAVPGGEYGELILSRYPLQDIQCHVFPSEEGCESRAVISARVRLGETGPEILFAATHLEHANVRVRLHQARELKRVLAEREPRLGILAGDLNATPDSDVLREITELWRDATATPPDPTWPADKPRVKIDYILYRPTECWRVVSSEVVPELMASDHRPVLVVLEWQGQ